MTSLFEPFDRSGLRQPNFVVMALMALMTRSRATAEGLATASMAAYFAQRATAGLIITEGIQPSLLGQSNPFAPGFTATDEDAEPRGDGQVGRQLPAHRVIGVEETAWTTHTADRPDAGRDSRSQFGGQGGAAAFIASVPLDARDRAKFAHLNAERLLMRRHR
ncbi:hypothetical protein FAIPA1_210081 [Frankia sp. AiPs1]|nr:hypothetical protein [Frankia sp. AiPa1]MCL9758565.1 hypothetical protein [Frankia sp. AiPa1]